MKILVTGAAGFIGSNYVRRQLADAYPETAGAEVTVLDKLTYAGTLTNLTDVSGSPNYRSSRATSAMSTSSTTSCPATTPWCTSLPSRTSTVRSRAPRTSSSPTCSAPRRCCRRRSTRGSSRFVHVSTDEVYGSIPEGSWDENRPLEPNSPYSASKAGSDLLARAYGRTFGMEVCITRCSNNYGPHQFPEKVIPLFVTNLMDGLQVPALRRGAERPRLAARRRPLSRYQPGPGQGPRGRDVQHRWRHRADQRRAHRAPAGRHGRRLGDGPPGRGPQGPRPSLLRGHHQDRRRARVRPRGAVRAGPL